MRLLINSRHPSITVETPEEARVEALLLDVAAEPDSRRAAVRAGAAKGRANHRGAGLREELGGPRGRAKFASGFIYVPFEMGEDGSGGERLRDVPSPRFAARAVHR